MAPRKGDERFKRWLIEKLKSSRWPYSRDLPLSELSEKLGVREEVLRIAQAELDADRRLKGLPLTRLGNPTRAEKAKSPPKVNMQLPREIYERLMDQATARGVTRGALLRSAIFAFLRQPKRPKHEATRGWVLDGVLVSIPWEPESAKDGHSWWPYWVTATLSYAAKEALTLRAQSMGCSEFALIRAIILDTIAGHLRDFALVLSVTALPDALSAYITE